MFNLVKNIEMVEQQPIELPGQTPKQPKKQSNVVSRFFKKLLLFLFLILIVFLGSTYFYFNFTYSEGSRAGMLLKFSEKGYFFKTYEGELNLGGVNPLPGNTIINNMWAFSVTNDSIGNVLKSKEGQMLRLHYKEKVKNLPWQGDTKYFVDRVEVINK